MNLPLRLDEVAHTFLFVLPADELIINIGWQLVKLLDSEPSKLLSCSWARIGCSWAGGWEFSKYLEMYITDLWRDKQQDTCSIPRNEPLIQCDSRFEALEAHFWCWLVCTSRFGNSRCLRKQLESVTVLGTVNASFWSTENLVTVIMSEEKRTTRISSMLSKTTFS